MCARRRTQASTHARTRVHESTRAHTHTHTHTHTRTHARTRTHTRTYAHTRAHTRTHTHTCTHTQALDHLIKLASKGLRVLASSALTGFHRARKVVMHTARSISSRPLGETLNIWFRVNDTSRNESVSKALISVQETTAVVLSRTPEYIDRSRQILDQVSPALAHAHTYTRTHAHTHTRTHARAHTHTHTRTHTPSADTINSTTSTSRQKAQARVCVR